MEMTESPKEKYARLAQKYPREADWYIEYPHKRNWTPQFGDKEFREGLKKFFAGKSGIPTLLYLHVPFCATSCYFCCCHYWAIGKNIDDKTYEKHFGAYMPYLHAEIDLFIRFCEEGGVTPNIHELHFGGGTPSLLHNEDFKKLVDKIKPLVAIPSLREFALEIDPRSVSPDELHFYRDCGVNRISFGVQDIDPVVMKAVNRIQPPELTEAILTPENRALFPNGINFDIICGLPHQTLESFTKTIEWVLKISPDRISLTFYAHNPSVARTQKLIEKDLPDIYDKKLLFVRALELLEANGYIRSGYDHFAKKTDAVAKAKAQRKMTWNSFGFTPGECVNVLGLGVHSYSTLGDMYAQNCYERDQYKTALDKGLFPISRGHIRTRDDYIRFDVIQSLRGYFFVDFRVIEKTWDIVFTDYFKNELLRLKKLEEDGVVKLLPTSIQITELGEQFGNLACEAFDNYFKH